MQTRTPIQAKWKSVYKPFSWQYLYAMPLHLFTESTTFIAQPPLITSVCLNHCCCTPPSPTTSASNANTGPGLPIIISTLSEVEGNMQQILKSLQLPQSWMSLCRPLLRHCLYRSHDNRDTETVWAVAPAHPAGPKVPLCVSIVVVVEQEMPVMTTVDNYWIKGQWFWERCYNENKTFPRANRLHDEVDWLIKHSEGCV